MSKYCSCKVCNRKFLYGDCQSPMLSNKKWDEVVSFYDLKEYENKAMEKYRLHCEKVGNYKAKHIDDEHLYICYECMEKALGRKIRRSDLIGKDIPLNEYFEYMYF